MRRIVIAGTGSHCGKTTLACGLLAAFRNKGLTVSAYKTGPDYIDPQYLRQSGNCEACNLDTWLMSEERTLELFARTSRGTDIAIVEGAMALYDGGNHSTAEIAKLLRASVILVVDAKSLGESAAAVVLGFREYDPDVNLAGVVLNNAGSDYHVKIIADELARLGVNFLGALRRNDVPAVPERHLGLVPVSEGTGFDVEAVRAAVEESINLGSVYESAVASELLAHGYDLYYYDNKSKGEVDYLIDDFDILSAVPIEVKSGKNYTKHKALDKFVANPDYHIKRAVVLSNDREFREDGKTMYVPIYFVMFFRPSTPMEIQL